MRELREEALMSLQSGRTHVKEGVEEEEEEEAGGREDGEVGGWRMILHCCRRRLMTMMLVGGVCILEEGERGEHRISPQRWGERGRGRHSMG